MLLDRDRLQVPGPHNTVNALAAAALARAVGVPAEAVGRGLAGFRGGAHRNVRVATVAGVDYVDDSKATNPHAAGASLAAYPRVVWIAGGLLKGADVDPLVAAVASRLAGVVLLGRDRAVLAASLARHAPTVPVVTVISGDDDGMDGTGVTGEATMAQVVAAAAELARPGRHRAPGPRRGLHGRLPRLRPPRPGLRRRGGGPAMTADHHRRVRGPPAPGPVRPAAPGRRRPPAPGTSGRARLRGPAWLDGPMTSCHLVLGAAGLLLTIGLVMVFSASSIEAALADEPAWKPGVQQLIWAFIGLGAMLVALRLPAGFLRRWSPIALIVVLVMLLLVLVPGHRPEAQRRPPVVQPRLRATCSPRRSPSWSSRSGARTCWRCASAT